MPPRMLHRWLLSTKSAPSHLRLTSRGPIGSILTSNATASSRFPAQRSNNAVFQTRHVHQLTSYPRRRLTMLRITGTIVACFIGAHIIRGVVHVATGGTIPPYVWARKADQQTRVEVSEIMTKEFDTARNSAPHQLNAALREATFRVPHELARLNNDAPLFRLEDLGPMGYSKETRDMIDKKYPSLAPFIDCEETRVFLYFPMGATQATAIFLAVNAELRHPLHLHHTGCCADSDSWFKRAVHTAAEVALLTKIWKEQHKLWSQSRPDVMGRIKEMERLPIIINFREQAFGIMYYQRLESILDRSMFGFPLVITDLDRGILSQYG